MKFILALTLFTFTIGKNALAQSKKSKTPEELKMDTLKKKLSGVKFFEVLADVIFEHLSTSRLHVIYKPSKRQSKLSKYMCDQRLQSVIICWNYNSSS